MALFGSKNKEANLSKKNAQETNPSKKDAQGATTKSSAVSTISIPKNMENILIQPRITEKASFRTGGNVYTFEIAMKATKADVKKAVESLYKVTPERVNTTKIPAKKTFSRGKWGVKKGGKKAYVYLKEGDSIELN